jgi:hypothetical protein
MNHYRRTGNVPQHVVDHFGPKADYDQVAHTVGSMNSDPIKFGSTHHELGHAIAVYNSATDRIGVSPGWHAMKPDERASILIHEISHKHGAADRFYKYGSGYRPTRDKNRDVYRPCKLFR